MKNTVYIKNLNLLICSCNTNSFKHKRCLNCSTKAVQINLKQEEKSLLKYKFSIKTNSSVKVIDGKILVEISFIQNTYNKLTKKLICKEETKLLEITEQNFEIHFKYLIKHLNKEKLVTLINCYNKLYKQSSPIVIYNPLNLNLGEIYYLTKLMIKYPKLSNIQLYFKTNILLMVLYEPKAYHQLCKKSLKDIDLFILDGFVKDKHINKRINYSKNKIHQMLNISKEFLVILNEEGNKRLLMKEHKPLNYNLFDILIINYNYLGKNIVIYNQLFYITERYHYLEDFIKIYSQKSKKNTKQILCDIMKERERNYFLSSEDIINYYKDYVNMSKELNIEYKETLKDIKLRHDILVDRLNLLYKLKKDFVQIDLADVYKDFNYEKEYDDFVFIKPKKSEDVIVEGYKLKHCVGSYLKYVYNGSSLIYFLREKDNIEKPFVTIEIVNNEVVQVKGAHNRDLKLKELKVLKLWANDFDLQINKNL